MQMQSFLKNHKNRKKLRGAFWCALLLTGQRPTTYRVINQQRRYGSTKIGQYVMMSVPESVIDQFNYTTRTPVSKSEGNKLVDEWARALLNFKRPTRPRQTATVPIIRNFHWVRVTYAKVRHTHTHTDRQTRRLD